MPLPAQRRKRQQSPDPKQQQSRLPQSAKHRPKRMQQAAKGHPAKTRGQRAKTNRQRAQARRQRAKAVRRILARRRQAKDMHPQQQKSQQERDALAVTPQHLRTQRSKDKFFRSWRSAKNLIAHTLPLSTCQSMRMSAFSHTMKESMWHQGGSKVLQQQESCGQRAGSRGLLFRADSLPLQQYQTCAPLGF